jgi:hypothetical protein
MEIKTNPISEAAQRAAAGGGNVSSCSSRWSAHARHFECPNAVPIRDCAPSSGAWYTVEFESYACSAEALRTLNIRNNGYPLAFHRRAPAHDIIAKTPAPACPPAPVSGWRRVAHGERLSDPARLGLAGITLCALGVAVACSTKVGQRQTR